MKLSTREDVMAPADWVMARLTEFEALEAALRERGVEVTCDREGARGVGTRWRARYGVRGRAMETDARLVAVDPRGYRVEAVTGGVTSLAEVTVEAVTEARTRVFASVDFRPTTIGSRILLQSLKLAKPRLTERFSARVATYVAGLQARWDRER